MPPHFAGRVVSIGTIAGGASGLSRIGTLVEGHPDGFYVIGDVEVSQGQKIYLCDFHATVDLTYLP